MPPPHTRNLPGALSGALTKIAASVQTILPSRTRDNKSTHDYVYDHTPEQRGVVPMPPLPRDIPAGATFHPYDGRVPLHAGEARSVRRSVEGFNAKAKLHGATERASHAPDHTYIDVVDTGRTATAHNGAEEPLLLCRIQAVPPADADWPHPDYYISYEHPDFRKRPTSAYFRNVPHETNGK